MYSPNRDSSFFGEFLPLSLGGDQQQGHSYSSEEYNTRRTDSAVAAPKSICLKLLGHLEKKPNSAEIKKNVAAYYDKLCALSDSPGTAYSEYSEYMDMLDGFALHVVGERAKIKPLNILSIGSGPASREELITTKFKPSIGSLVVNDASERMCAKASNKGFDAMPGFFQDLLISEQMLKFDVALALNCTEHLTSLEDMVRFFHNLAISITDDGVILIDFFSVKDPGGWGNQLEDAYIKNNLAARGYDMGEYFYENNAFAQTSYARYFARNQVVDLLNFSGLEVRAIEYFDQSTGEIMNETNDGSFIMVLQKRI